MIFARTASFPRCFVTHTQCLSTFNAGEERNSLAFSVSQTLNNACVPREVDVVNYECLSALAGAIFGVMVNTHQGGAGEIKSIIDADATPERHTENSIKAGTREPGDSGGSLPPPPLGSLTEKFSYYPL